MNQITNRSKLVVVTREDLSPGLQVAQTTHAAVDFCLRNPDLAKEWNTVSNYLVCLAVKDENALQSLIKRCQNAGLRHYVFREPDVGNQITAICIEPSEITQKLISNIPLALKEEIVKDVIIVHYNKAHNSDISIPPWVIKHKGNTYYVNHIEFKNKDLNTKETPLNDQTKASLKFKGKLILEESNNLITAKIK